MLAGVIHDETYTLLLQPAVARILRLAFDDEVDPSELGRALSTDKSIARSVIALINASELGLRTKVTSTVHAAGMLGLRVMQTLSAGVAFREVLWASTFHDNETARLGVDALRRAIAAKLLAEHTDTADRDLAYRIGLILDLGLIALYRGKRAELANHASLDGATPSVRWEKELERFKATHDEIGARVARHYGLPELVAGAIEHHHAVEKRHIPQMHVPLARIAHHADQIAAVFSASDKITALREARNGLERDYGMDAQEVDQILSRMPKLVEEAARMDGLSIEHHPRFDEVLAEIANNSGPSYEELASELKIVREEKAALEARLHDALTALEKLEMQMAGAIPARDFIARLKQELDRSDERGRPVSHARIELGRLPESLRRTVLTLAVRTVAHIARPQDSVAKLRAGEIAILMPDTGEDEGAALLAQMAAAIEALDVSAQVEVFGGGATHYRERALSARSPLEALEDRVRLALRTARAPGGRGTHWAPRIGD